jgi:hypothetical protein
MLGNYISLPYSLRIEIRRKEILSSPEVVLCDKCGSNIDYNLIWEKFLCFNLILSNYPFLAVLE